MTLTVISTDTISTGVQYNAAAADDDLLLLAGVNLISTNNDAISVNFANVDLTILGTVYGQDDGIDLGFDADSAVVTIGATGSVLADDNGFVVRSSDTSIYNNGLISGDIGYLYSFQTNNNVLYNSGIIKGIGDSTTNDGVGVLLSGLGTDFSLLNSGDIIGNTTGVVFFATSSVLNNSGLIHGHSQQGLVVSSSSNQITNSGTISSNADAVSTFSAAVQITSVFNVLMSTGDIFGAYIGIRATGNDNKVVNQGVISATGDDAVQMLGNNGTFINRGDVVSAGDGVRFDGTGNHVTVNTGTITADEIGIGGFNTSSASSIVNTGTIYAGLQSIVITNSGGTSTFGHEILNRGTLLGDVELSEGDDLYYGKWGTIEGDIFMGAGNDTATGGAEDNRIEGGAGNDRLNGLGGDDNLFGDDGNDVLRGGDGDDGVNGGADNDDLGGGNGDDVLLGADGNDLLRGDMGADILNGGDGFDRASYRDSSEGITLNLADTSQSSGIAESDSYISIEAYEGSNFNDFMYGDDVNNLLRGMDGDDSLFGRGGNDNLQGFDDDDYLVGGTGNDTLNGGDGTDTAYFGGNQADFTFTLLGNGNIRVEDTVGDNGVDVLVSIELVSFYDAFEVDVTGLI